MRKTFKQTVAQIYDELSDEIAPGAAALSDGERTAILERLERHPEFVRADLIEQDRQAMILNAYAENAFRFEKNNSI